MLVPAEPERRGENGEGNSCLLPGELLVSWCQLVRASPEKGTRAQPAAASGLLHKRTGKGCPVVMVKAMPQRD